MVRSEVYAPARKIKDLRALTCNSGTLNRKSYFERGTHHPASLIPLPDIFPDDHGGYAVYLDGPAFPTRRFAEAVRISRTRHRNIWLRQ
jgi:hypothetical protein